MNEKRDRPYRGFGYLSFFSVPKGLATYSPYMRHTYVVLVHTKAAWQVAYVAHTIIRHTYVAVYMPRNRDVCAVYLSYLLRTDMCGVSSTLFSYLRRISDVRVAYLSYQWRMCYVCATFVSLPSPTLGFFSLVLI